MQINGEAIYGTSPWRVFHEGAPEGPAAAAGGAAPVSIRFTAKGNSLYAVCLAWPDQELVVRALGTRGIPGKQIAAVRMLGATDEVKWQQTEAGLTLTVPRVQPCRNAFVYRIDFKQD
jgi:alpha-L-fucosidase